MCWRQDRLCLSGSIGGVRSVHGLKEVMGHMIMVSVSLHIVVPCCPPPPAIWCRKTGFFMGVFLFLQTFLYKFGPLNCLDCKLANDIMACARMSQKKVFLLETTFFFKKTLFFNAYFVFMPGCLLFWCVNTCWRIRNMQTQFLIFMTTSWHMMMPKIFSASLLLFLFFFYYPHFTFFIDFIVNPHGFFW